MKKLICSLVILATASMASNTYSMNTKTVKITTFNTVTFAARSSNEQSYPIALVSQNGCMFIATAKKDKRDRYQLTVKNIQCPAKVRDKDKYNFSHTMIIGEDGLEGVLALRTNDTDIILKNRKLTLIGQD